MDQEIKRGPGRPKFHEQVAVNIAAATPPAAVTAESPPRPSRKPFGAMDQKLAYADRPNFHRHWFNDIGGRIQRASEAGYEHVKDKEGRNVSKVVGVAEGGGAQTAFLMEIPEDWYQADIRAQQEEINVKEQTIKRGAHNQLGEHGYVPSQGISIKHGQ